MNIAECRCIGGQQNKTGFGVDRHCWDNGSVGMGKIVYGVVCILLLAYHSLLTVLGDFEGCWEEKDMVMHAGPMMNA